MAGEARAIINVVRELSQGTQRFMPENLALNLGDAGGLGGLTALVPLAMRRLSQGTGGEGDAAVAPRLNGSSEPPTAGADGPPPAV